MMMTGERSATIWEMTTTTGIDATTSSSSSSSDKNNTNNNDAINKSKVKGGKKSSGDPPAIKMAAAAGKKTSKKDNRTKKEDPNTDDDGDASSVASSLSSIPLSQLKKHMATKLNKKKTAVTKAKTSKRTSTNSSSPVGTGKPAPTKGTKKTGTTTTKREAISASIATAGTRKKSTAKTGSKKLTKRPAPKKIPEDVVKDSSLLPKSSNNKKPKKTNEKKHTEEQVVSNKEQVNTTNPLVSPEMPEEGETTHANSSLPTTKIEETAGTTSRASEEDDDDEEEAACCLCHCGVDCSDRALFFPKDRKKEFEEEEGNYYFQMEDPFLPQDLYDQHNALVYCDSCSRLYHQKCHFVPLLVVPRGEWNCLLCSLQQQQQQQKQQRPKKQSPKKSKTTSVATTVVQNEPWKKFCDKNVTKELFTSPPPATLSTCIRELQDEFELLTAEPKAQLWHRQLLQLRTFLKSQGGNIRMATAALDTLTSTKRNRAHFAAGGRKSQELAQTLVRLATAKWKIRTALLSLENIRVAANILPPDLLQWAKDHPKHLEHVFPHGTDLYETRSRTIPRTREMEILPVVLNATTPPAPSKNGQLSTTSPTPETLMIPTEISVPSPKYTKKMKSISALSPKSPKRLKSMSSLSPKSPRMLLKAPPMMPDFNVGFAGPSVVVGPNGAHAVTNGKKTNDGDDGDSGISLDDLKCCVCFVGDATDENDVLLCDGQGCCRAYHMNCVFPRVQTKDIENEDEDWFCPLCNAISHLTNEVQTACVDEDWEHRRETEEYQQLENSSLQSWGNAHQVFPEAEWEYNASMKYKAGKQTEETARLLAKYLGDDFFEGASRSTVPMPVGSDSEDENDYSLFDEESFEERRRREREGGDKDNNDDDDDDSDEDSDESTRSSQASLGDMSSVELNIGKSELAALSDGGGDDSSNDDDDSSLSGVPSTSSAKQRRRSSLRLRRKTTTSTTSGHSSLVDNGADFDESNIIEGKRRRTFVDYRKLNDALFGDLSAKERAKIDDKDDFEVKKKKTNRMTKKDQASKSSNGRNKRKSNVANSKKGAQDVKASKRLKREEAKSESEAEDVSDGEGSQSSSDSDES